MYDILSLDPYSPLNIKHSNIDCCCWCWCLLSSIKSVQVLRPWSSLYILRNFQLTWIWLYPYDTRTEARWIGECDLKIKMLFASRHTFYLSILGHHHTIKACKRGTKMCINSQKWPKPLVVAVVTIKYQLCLQVAAKEKALCGYPEKL